MNLHKVIVRPGIRTSERFGRLNFFQRDLYYGLLSAANTKGSWFEANAALLRPALFAPCLGKVSERDVRDGLLKLREVGLIKLWTGRNGRAYGAVEKYGQRFAYGEVLPEEAYPPGDELPLDEWSEEAVPDEPEPPPPTDKPKRIEERGKFARRANGAPAPTELREDALARLARAFPHVNVLQEFEKAAKKKGGQVDLRWFEDEWLSKCGQVVTFSPLPGGAGAGHAIEPEPEAWKLYLKDKYEGEDWAGTAQCCAWAGLPRNWREKIAREMAARGQRAS